MAKLRAALPSPTTILRHGRGRKVSLAPGRAERKGRACRTFVRAHLMLDFCMRQERWLCTTIYKSRGFLCGLLEGQCSLKKPQGKACASPGMVRRERSLCSSALGNSFQCTMQLFCCLLWDYMERHFQQNQLTFPSTLQFLNFPWKLIVGRAR